MDDYTTQSGTPTPPDTTREGRRRLEFPANIALRTLTPKEGTTSPSIVQIVMWHDRLPFQFVLESPDPLWLTEFAGSLIDAADEINKNPENASYVGKQLIDDVSKIDPITFEGRVTDTVDETDDSSNNEE